MANTVSAAHRHGVDTGTRLIRALQSCGYIKTPSEATTTLSRWLVREPHWEEGVAAAAEARHEGGKLGGLGSPYIV